MKLVGLLGDIFGTFQGNSRHIHTNALNILERGNIQLIYELSSNVCKTLQTLKRNSSTWKMWHKNGLIFKNIIHHSKKLEEKQ